MPSLVHGKNYSYCNVLPTAVLKMKITEFRESIVEDMLSKRDVTRSSITHKLVKFTKGSRCWQCYRDIVTRHGRKVAQRDSPRMWTKCFTCANFFYNIRFFNTHTAKLQ